MKKVKLLPSLIMLVLCMGVLAVGVFALNPISNSIAGTISISAGKASLAITGYVDDAVVYPRTELNGGIDWTIDSSKLNFNAGNYLFPEQVPSKEIKLVIENLSNVPYGVFFCDTAGVNATSSNIKTSGEVKSGTTTIVNASMDYYKYISVADATTTHDQAEMTITMSVANISTSAQTGSFAYYLNVEQYNSSLNTTEEFIKIDDNLTAIAENAYADSTELKNVIIPSTITSIGAGAFSGCTGISEITIPASVTTIGAGAFDGCISLHKVMVIAHSTSGNFGDDANLPSFAGKAWYLNEQKVSKNDNGQQILTFSIEDFVYTLNDVAMAEIVVEIIVESSQNGIFEEDGIEFYVTIDGECEVGNTITLTLCSTETDSYYVEFSFHAWYVNGEYCQEDDSGRLILKLKATVAQVRVEATGHLVLKEGVIPEM